MSLLFLIAIPWWWQLLPNIGNRVVWGAPIWFITSVVGSLVISMACSRYLAVAWESLEPVDATEEVADEQ